MHRLILAVLITAALLCLFPIGVLIVRAEAHEWYSMRRDPVTGQSCCGGNDCSRWKIRAGSIKAEKEGFRVVLTLEETFAINPYSQAPIDAVVRYDRVQASEDGDWHLCISIHRRDDWIKGVYCLFQPPST
jgi:hypothetical protein